MFNCVEKTKFQLPISIIERVQDEILAGTIIDAPPYWTKIRPFAGEFHVEDSTDRHLLKTANGIKERFCEAEKFWNKPLTILKQSTLSDELTQTIADILPNSIKQLNPRICVQIIEGGNTTPPHKDNSRMCSLFYLINSNNAETTFWKYLPGEEEKQKLPLYPQISSIEPFRSFVLDEHCWYIFNTKEIHSVHIADSTKKRITLCLEFANTSAEELANLIDY